MDLLEMFRNWEDVEKYKARTVIFAEQDPADLMYVILSGEVELTLLGEPLGMESEGCIFGEMAMLGPTARRSATATTLSKVKLAKLNRDQFRGLVGQNTDFALHIMNILANRLIVANNYITRNLN